MWKIKLKTIVVTILIFSMVVINTTFNCYALTGSEFLQSVINSFGILSGAIPDAQVTDQMIYSTVKHTFDSVGFLIDETGITIQKIKDAINGVDNNFDNTNSDNDDVAQWIMDNTSVISGNVVYGDQYNSFIKNYSNTYMSNNGYYICYSYDVSQVSGWNLSSTQISFIQSNQSNYIVIVHPSRRSDTRYAFITLVPKSLNLYLYGQNSSGSYFMPYFCNSAGEKVNFSNLSGVKTYNGNLVQISNDEAYNNSIFVTKYNNVFEGSVYSDFYCTYGYCEQLIMYTSTSSIGNTLSSNSLPYYYNNTVWDNFEDNSTGDYVVDSNNINTVTYGDTVSYINNYYTENNNYPDNSTVNNWITNTNTENIENNNSGGDDSGGGSGDDSGGSGTGIVSILTALGKAIADLITGIVAFLAEIIGGLVEAITGLLDTLTDIITTFTESIPNIFSPLIGWLFDGLPEEFTAIILLGLSACVIASIIKILRG